MNAMNEIEDQVQNICIFLILEIVVHIIYKLYFKDTVCNTVLIS